MICEERTEMKHAKKANVISMLRHQLIASHEDLLITPHNTADWLRDQQLSLKVWQARCLWQSYDPIQAGHLPPK